jgi:hypothetical protein
MRRRRFLALAAVGATGPAAVDGCEPFARAGNVMTYGPGIQDVCGRLAEYVDRIRKGGLRAIIGITISPVLLAVANKVI